MLSFLHHVPKRPAHIDVLDLTSRTMLGKEYKLLNSSSCHFLRYLPVPFFSGLNILSTQHWSTLTFLGVCDYRRGMDWLVNLLATCIHHSELQVITALLLISTLQITPR
jgi:hypothetical protein